MGGIDAGAHVLTFGPHQGTMIKDAPFDYVGQLAGYRVVDDMPTREHEFDELCYNIMIGHGSPCICKTSNNHSTKCMLFSWGSTPYITEGLLIDHIYTRILDYHAATQLRPWVDDYVEHTKDVVAARQYMDERHARLIDRLH